MSEIVSIPRTMMQLSAATVPYMFTRKSDAVNAVHHLMTCQEHSGVHHFYVIESGLGVVMSEAAVQCLGLERIR
jgi:hypothetical protein